MDADLTIESLTRYLQERSPGSHLETFATIAGGFSKQTTLFTVRHASGEREKLVIRKDLPADFISSVASEYSLLKHLFSAGFPVAEPVWLENHPRLFSGRLLVSRLVGGSTDVSKWATDPRAAEGFARELATLMARLHAIPLERLCYDASVIDSSAGHLMQAEISSWHQTFIDSRLEAYPLVELVMSWLKQHIPSSLFERSGVMVHGDIGFHDLMIDAGNITALLDWEFALRDSLRKLCQTISNLLRRDSFWPGISSQRLHVW